VLAPSILPTAISKYHIRLFSHLDASLNSNETNNTPDIQQTNAKTSDNYHETSQIQFDDTNSPSSPPSLVSSSSIESTISPPNDSIHEIPPTSASSISNDVTSNTITDQPKFISYDAATYYATNPIPFQTTIATDDREDIHKEFNSSRSIYRPPFPIPSQNQVIADPYFVVVDGPGITSCPNPYYMQIYHQIKAEEYNNRMKNAKNVLPITISPTESGLGEESIVIQNSNKNFIAPSSIFAEDLLAQQNAASPFPRPLPSVYLQSTGRIGKYEIDNVLDRNPTSRLLHAFTLTCTTLLLLHTMLEGDEKTPSGREHIFSDVRRKWKAVKAAFYEEES
jgi:hypothetical protein